MPLRILLPVLFCLGILACGKKTLVIDDAGEPATLELRSAAEATKSIELEVHGLLSTPARVLLIKPSAPDQIWKQFELIPMVMAGMPRGIVPVTFHSDYAERELLLKYEPGKKTSGSLEIRYRFK